MYIFLIVLTIVSSVLLIMVVLAQNPKGGGLSSQFGGSGTSQVMGVKRTGDFLEKTTWVLSVVIVMLCLSSFIFMSNTKKQGPPTTPALEETGGPQNIPQPPTQGNNPLGIEQQDTSGSGEGGGTNLPEGLGQ